MSMPIRSVPGTNIVEASVGLASETDVHSKNLKLSKNQDTKKKQKERKLSASVIGSFENISIDTSTSGNLPT
ncbi:hypothetical protein LIER_40369 [Lithospermum erythrorhizon]|uniref:Uncharacterized protein n=1 Tax=Lithospermum erythrorhizon TaxID=34254 RepID=A0AAV3QTJ2_LITER